MGINTLNCKKKKKRSKNTERNGYSFRDICIEQNGFKVLNYWPTTPTIVLLGKGTGKMIKFWRWLKSLFIKEYQVTIC